jgi:hypothetical protein
MAMDREFRLPALPRLPGTERGVARVHGPPIVARGRLGLPSLAGVEAAVRAFPDPPPDFDGTDSEWAIYFAHRVLGRGEEGEEIWDYKTPLFGSPAIVGFVPDFSEYEERVAIDVVDIGAAEEQLATVRVNAILRRAILSRFTYQYIIIESDDAEEDPVALLSEALLGIDHSRFASS